MNTLLNYPKRKWQRLISGPHEADLCEAVPPMARAIAARLPQDDLAVFVWLVEQARFGCDAQELGTLAFDLREVVAEWRARERPQ